MAETRYFHVGIHDAKSGDLVVLFYVDRPCVIHGTSSGQPYTLQVAHKGLNWIRARPNGGEPRLSEPRYDLIYSLKEIRR